MKKIVVVGYKGKMGSVVFETLKAQGFNVFGKDKEDDFDCFCDVSLVIDFGGADSSVESANWCKKHKVNLIVGSTGQTESEMQQIKSVAEHVAVMIAGNFSVGVLMMKKMIELMRFCEVEDVCVFEKHHKHKLDAPSGTAKELQAQIEKQLFKTPQILSVRGGQEVGTHTIDFYFGSEVIEISHKAFSRDAFAKGVVLAVLFMQKVTGCGEFCFEDVFFKCDKL